MWILFLILDGAIIINDAYMMVRDWDENGKTWRMRPNHNWASHGADAFRYLAIGYQPYNQNWDKPLRRNLKGVV